MFKHILIIIAFVFSSIINIESQNNCPNLGPNQVLPCNVTSTTLTANFNTCPNLAQPNSTTSYSVTNIPFAPAPIAGTSVFLSDDAQAGPFNIGFTFCFFGNTYNQFWIGSNGWISFSGGQPNTFVSVPIPSMAGNVPKNCIMGPWQDWHPGVGGQIRFQTIGQAPCRRLIVTWSNLPLYSCTFLQGTFQIILYESTNIIENHIFNKPSNCFWAGGTAVQGIHNINGTAAFTVPGRNSTVWGTTSNSHRYTPNGAPVPPTVTWFQVGNPSPIGTGNSIVVFPPSQGANYTCQLSYPLCNQGFATCSNINLNIIPDTVFVLPGQPNIVPLFFPVGPLCQGASPPLLPTTSNNNSIFFCFYYFYRCLE